MILIIFTMFMSGISLMLMVIVDINMNHHPMLTPGERIGFSLLGMALCITAIALTFTDY